MNKLILVMMGLLTAGMLMGAPGIVSETSDTLTYRQADDQVVTVRKRPQRVIIGYVSLASAWYCAGGKAIGVPKVRTLESLPSEARELPRIGGIVNPNMEKILSMQPDLVLMSGKQGLYQAQRETFRRAGADTLCIEVHNYRDFLELMDLFCRLNGSSLEKTPAARKVPEEVERICAIAKKQKPVRFLVVFGSPLSIQVEQADMHTSTVAAMLGGINVITQPGYSRRKFSMERILLEDPEVILVVTMGASDKVQPKLRRELMSQAAWKQLKAVKNDRVYFLPSELFLFHPGPRFPEAFRMLAELMYPGIDLK